MKDCEKKHGKSIKIFPKKKKTKSKKGLEKDIKILLKQKKKKNITIIVKVIKAFLRNKSRSYNHLQKILEELSELRKSCNHKRNIDRIYYEKLHYNYLQQFLTVRLMILGN